MNDSTKYNQWNISVLNNTIIIHDDIFIKDYDKYDIIICNDRLIIKYKDDNKNSAYYLNSLNNNDDNTKSYDVN